MSPELRVLTAGCLIVVLVAVDWRMWLEQWRLYRRLSGGRWRRGQTGDVEDYDALTMSKDWRTQMRRQG